ncbi:putative toxin-antitoxin system toxin component, PIN family [Rhodoferax sp.]|uniref:putative toxin-antitoxin system toxin component, PIN family n=1 Tax=Rhodoferax sp. TaxID=50421 RepID=UPI00271F50DB|nr:putative toxin-antitoxin system toxin component, PIN family [Rhodoferax sp.]MDO8318945.1 putative toxin-antitoxin system toxin component, PIN family [Rhodoferax sp.]
MRVVLDTNVVLSALVFGGGLAGRLRMAWQTHEVLPLVNTDTAQELIRVLAYPKFHLSRPDQQQLLADYLPYSQTVHMPESMPTVPECRDPYDLMFMRLAVVGQAQVLVSGDKDLLTLATAFKSMTGCTILGVDDFLNGR